MINIAKKVIKSSDLKCIEAINVSEIPKYDAVLSNSVFSYFPDFNYANTVLEKLFNKAQYVIGLIDIHDIEKKEGFINFRKANIKDYEIKYKNLNKLFYSKEFFRQFAQKHNMRIKFTKSTVDGYWNNEYVFNCYLYKQEV